MPGGILGNSKGQECGRTIFFGITQESLASTIYTSSKLIRGAFGFVHNLVMILQEMNKDESLFTTSYYFVMRLQLYMSFLVTHDMLIY